MNRTRLRALVLFIFGREFSMPKFSLREDRQLESVDQTQLDLPLSRRARPVLIPAQVAAAQPTKIAAIKLCISSSGLSADEVCRSLRIDSGHWARMMSDKAYFPNNKEQALMDLCGNEIPLIWDIERRGYDFATLRKHNSDLEKRVVQLQAQLEQERHDRAVEREYAKHMRTG